jgi:ferrous iron transport protein A
MDHDEVTLAGLPIGVEAKVTNLIGDNRISQRLMEMGVVPGVIVRVLKTAPAGDPLEILVRGYHLALRRNEAQAIGVSYER